MEKALPRSRNLKEFLSQRAAERKATPSGARPLGAKLPAIPQLKPSGVAGFCWHRCVVHMNEGKVRVMIYKRTHTGDPASRGVFGLRDCMGSVRARNFDAVIGVGGLSAEARVFNIDGRLTWVGVGDRRSAGIPVGYRGPVIEFDRFRLFEQSGAKHEVIAPLLAQHLFAVHRRVVMSDSLDAPIRREIGRVRAE
jgi:hypothetical protein